MEASAAGLSAAGSRWASRRSAKPISFRPSISDRGNRRVLSYSSASPRRRHPSVPPRRTATSPRPAASSSVAALADRRSVLQTTTIGCRRAASSPARPGRSAIGTLTAPGRWPGGAMNSSGWRTSTRTTASPTARRRCNSTTSIHAGSSARGRRINGIEMPLMASAPRVSSHGAELTQFPPRPVASEPSIWGSVAVTT